MESQRVDMTVSLSTQKWFWTIGGKLEGEELADWITKEAQRKSNPASGYFPLSLIDIISLRYH